MRVLFIGSKDIFGKVMSGGMQCSKRNYDLICSVIGEKNVYSAIVWNADNVKITKNNRYFKRAKNRVEEVISNLTNNRLYKMGEDRKILAYIKKISPDVIFWDTSLFGKLIEKVDKKIKNIVFMENVEVDYARNRIKHGGIIFLPVYVSTLYNEKRAVKYADKIVLLTNRDKKRVEKLYGRQAEYILPIGLEDTFMPKKIKRGDEKNTLLFIGSNFPPNYDGIKWFVQTVMSELKEFNLLIIGKDFEKCRNELTRDNVKVVGTVEDLGEYYYRYSNVVMPIRYGDGMKVKTAEALMYGMNIFATNEALEGYQVNKVEGVFRCNSVRGFIDAIRLHYKTYKFNEWNREGRSCYSDYYNPEHQKVIMDKILYDEER